MFIHGTKCITTMSRDSHCCVYLNIITLKKSKSKRVSALDFDTSRCGLLMNLCQNIIREFFF